MFSSPRPPFDKWPIQHVDARYGHAWYCGDGLIISQVNVPHGSREAAHAYHDFEEAMLREHAAEIERVHGIFVIHDWRAMETYDKEARTVWQDRMKLRHRGYLRGSVVCLLRATTFLRMAVQAANLVASVSHGAKVELSNDLDGTLRRYSVQQPGRYSLPPTS